MSKVTGECLRRFEKLEEKTEKLDRAYYLVIGGWATVMAIFGVTRIILEVFK